MARTAEAQLENEALQAGTDLQAIGDTAGRLQITHYIKFFDNFIAQTSPGTPPAPTPLDNIRPSAAYPQAPEVSAPKSRKRRAVVGVIGTLLSFSALAGCTSDPYFSPNSDGEYYGYYPEPPGSNPTPTVIFTPHNEAPPDLVGFDPDPSIDWAAEIPGPQPGSSECPDNYEPSVDIQSNPNGAKPIKTNPLVYRIITACMNDEHEGNTVELVRDPSFPETNGTGIKLKSGDAVSVDCVVEDGEPRVYRGIESSVWFGVIGEGPSDIGIITGYLEAGALGFPKQAPEVSCA